MILSMRAITATEQDLLTFFGVEPNRLDTDVPWIYNSLTYEIGQGDLTLKFNVAPSYKELSLELIRGGRDVYQFSGEVEDVEYSQIGKSESLVISLSKDATISLSLRPSIAVRHQQKRSPD